MADTTMKVDSATRDRFAAVAAAQGKSVRAYLAELAIEEENQLALGRATVAFREAVGKPGIAEAFDREFGGLPSSATTRRAA
ncbi:antitoxin MazE7 [Streptomyces sp. NBC_00162]|uniref:antitoxin MazE7 n=1 Tax=Streptomyces sp. NBC_00162 TaxID=2903629 RepID=UPI00214BDB41|nr:antitoxin MazE7 [Streptomyces sp. NBC_00162]UUU37873.1 antitoxin MazE7 [Streptomyces sp. NBC_00162]